MFTEDFDEFTARFSADGMIHAVQPMVLTPRGKQRTTHHSDTGDDPGVCLSCPYEDCSGSEKCYRKRKKSLEEKKKCQEKC